MTTLSETNPIVEAVVPRNELEASIAIKGDVRGIVPVMPSVEVETVVIAARHNSQPATGLQ